VMAMVVDADADHSPSETVVVSLRGMVLSDKKGASHKIQGSWVIVRGRIPWIRWQAPFSVPEGVALLRQHYDRPSATVSLRAEC
jgi:hypothetical protein